VKLFGLAVPYIVETELGDGTVEWIEPGALHPADAVTLVWGTHEGAVLASVSDGSLELRASTEGLLFEAWPAWQRGVGAAFGAVRRGEVGGASVLMQIQDYRETEIAGRTFRAISRAEIQHIALAATPAYPTTQAFAAGDDDDVYDLPRQARDWLARWDSARPFGQAAPVLRPMASVRPPAAVLGRIDQILKSACAHSPRTGRGGRP
jgi:hypothetical protein